MVFIKQEVPSWDDANSIDAHLDWEKDLGFTLMDLPTSEFLTNAAEIEQTYGGSSGTPNPWGDPVISPKLQIRNHDCMWSGTCFDQSHPGKRSCGTGANSCNGNSTNTTQDTSSGNGSNKFNSVTALAAAVLNSNAAAAVAKAILFPSNTSALNVSNNATTKLATSKTQAAQIPAGRSLLINSRNKQHQQQLINKVPTVSTADFLRERDSSVASLHTRPDTPLSLDDDPPEFKHNLDLATCTIGSNRLSLTGHSRHHHNSHDDPSSSRIINMLKEQLEDTESSSLRPYMTSATGDVGSLTDLLNDLQEMQAKDEIDTDDSQGEELDSDVDSNADVDADADGNCSSSSSSRSSRGGGGGLPGGYTHAHPQEMSPTSSLSSSSSSSSYEYQGTHVGDHSYTRPKNRYTMNGLGVQTPSDSEEEIDVVSIGEKNLPTNPTARDRRALQSHVAHKIARKQAQNVGGGPQHHHHHRRRHSDDDYSSLQGSSSSSGGSHSAAGSHSGSPSKHHHHHGAGAFSPNYLTPASSTSISGTNTPLPGGGSSSISNPRKRPSSKDDHRGGSGSSSGKNRHHQHRNKKQRVPGKKPSSSDSSEEQETLEKRNLHNDMERQRRIGLKNLFEELKLQIPGLREKERAPKVNILREAATLCQRLNREQEQLNALRKQQQRLYARVRQLRTSLHSQRRNLD